MKAVNLKAPEHLATRADAEANVLFAELMQMKPAQIDAYFKAHAIEPRALLLALTLGLRHAYHAETKRAP